MFAVNAAALLLRGPLACLGISDRIVRTPAPLAAGGRHLQAVLMAVVGWQDEQAAREALAALAPKLAEVELRVCRRKARLRMAEYCTK